MRFAFEVVVCCRFAVFRVLCHGDSLRGVRSYSSSAVTGSNHRPVGALVEFTVHQIDPQLQANLRRELRCVPQQLTSSCLLTSPVVNCMTACVRTRRRCFADNHVPPAPGKCVKPFHHCPTGITHQNQVPTTHQNGRSESNLHDQCGAVIWHLSDLYGKLLAARSMKRTVDLH